MVDSHKYYEDFHFLFTLKRGWSICWKWNCIVKVDYSDDPRAVRIAAALWWYYASKLFELLGIANTIGGIGIDGITPLTLESKLFELLGISGATQMGLSV